MTENQEGRVAIRTPDQRLRVFVSSTLVELADERAVVARAISALGLTPVLFELGARPHPPRELYRAYLSQSDIFIGLYWQRYGWIGPDMEISGLEDEFRLSGSIPRLLYVKAPAPEREPRLAAMIQELQTDGTESYRSFGTPRELGRLVRDDLALLLSEAFTRPGTRGGGTASALSEGDWRAARSLPVTSTSLIGRERDIAEVSELLQSPEVRLVTLTGPGGVGKTRLAIAVGERLDDRFAKGTAFVSLAAIDAPELVLPRIAAAVGAPMVGARRARSPGTPADRRDGVVAGRAAVRRSGAGGPPQLRPDRGQRRTYRGDLPARRRSPSRHRAGRRPHPSAAAGCVARAAGTKPGRIGHRLGRPPRTATNAACDRRMELRAARRSRATDAGHLVGLRRRVDGRSGRGRRRSHRGPDPRSARRARGAQPHHRRRRRPWAEVPHVGRGAGSRTGAPRRQRGPRRRREAARGALRCVRGERRLARGRTGRVGRAPAGGRGEPPGRHPLVHRA